MRVRDALSYVLFQESDLGKELLHVCVGSGNYVRSDNLAERACSCSACVNSSLNCADVATNHDGNQTGTDLFLADEGNVFPETMLMSPRQSMPAILPCCSQP